MFYGMFCGRRKRKPERVLNILLRARECAKEKNTAYNLRERTKKSSSEKTTSCLEQKICFFGLTG